MHGNGLGWISQYGTGKGADTITSGLEGAWTPTPTTWDNSYWDTLFGFDWELTESPAGAKQWQPSNPEAQELVPDAHIEGKKNPPMMSTADMALKVDPELRAYAERFRDDPEYFARPVRPRLVQAAAPRHGPEEPLPRPGRAERGPHLAGPGPGGRPRARGRRARSPTSSSGCSPPA